MGNVLEAAENAEEGMFQFLTETAEPFNCPKVCGASGTQLSIAEHVGNQESRDLLIRYSN